MKQKLPTTIYIRLADDPSLVKRLHDAAKAEGLKVNAYIRRLIVLSLKGRAVLSEK